MLFLIREGCRLEIKLDVDKGKVVALSSQKKASGYILFKDELLPAVCQDCG